MCCTRRNNRPNPIPAKPEAIPIMTVANNILGQRCSYGLTTEGSTSPSPVKDLKRRANVLPARLTAPHPRFAKNVIAAPGFSKLTYFCFRGYNNYLDREV